MEIGEIVLAMGIERPGWAKAYGVLIQ